MPYIYTPNGMVWVDEQPSAMDAPFWYGSYWGSQGIEGGPPEGGQYSNYDPLADIQAAQQYANQGYPTYEQPMFDQYGNPTFSVDTNWAAPSGTQGGAQYPAPTGMNATWLPGETPTQQAGGGGPGVYFMPEPPVFHAQGTGVADIPVQPAAPPQLPPYTGQAVEEAAAPGAVPKFSSTTYLRPEPVKPERSELPTRLTPGVVPPLPYEPAPMPNTVTPGPVPEVQKPKSKGDGTPFNIPIPTDDKGGGGAPMPVGNFPVVGGGPLMQSVFVPGIPQPIPIASLGQLIAGGLPYGR